MQSFWRTTENESKADDFGLTLSCRTSKIENVIEWKAARKGTVLGSHRNKRIPTDTKKKQRRKGEDEKKGQRFSHTRSDK